MGNATLPEAMLLFSMGFAAILFILSFDYQELHFWNYFFYVCVVLLLAAILVIGKTAGGAQRWINLGFFNLQPSEPAKLMLVITLASYFSRKEVTDGYTLKQLVTPVVLTSIPFLLILIQPDLGTALMLVIIFVSMTYLSSSGFPFMQFSGAPASAQSFCLGEHAQTLPEAARPDLSKPGRGSDEPGISDHAVKNCGRQRADFRQGIYGRDPGASPFSPGTAYRFRLFRLGRGMGFFRQCFFSGLLFLYAALGD